MTFQEVLAQVVTWLQLDKRVSYRALKRQFDLDEEYLEDLKYEIVEIQQIAVDQDSKMLIWTGDTTSALTQSVPSAQPSAASVPAWQQKEPPETQESRSTSTEPSPPEPPTPDAERRQLTVMFCDLADSTRLSGQLDPEDLRDVIRAYQATSAKVIERYDGYIAQHLGDGMMVYFGWPQAHEDDAQRAVHAGLGILKAMQGLNVRLEQEKDIRLAIRIGIHTGLVVVGEIGQGASQEHLALGETPNIASRIEGIARSDTVVISDATYQLVRGYFVCEDLGQHTLRGVDDAQRVYRVVRESDVQSRFDVTATRGLTPLVGRESESALLFDRWQQVKAGQGQVILLSGEAGIGKSRLLQMLRDHVADEPHTRLECRSSPYYQNTALYPITDMFQRVLGQGQNDTPQAKVDKLEQTLRAYRLELEETVPLFANLLSLTIPEDRYPLLNISPQRQRQKTLETIVAMLLQQTERQPVLFILEDLHWTDPSTLELLDLLIEQTPTAAICVLLTCRPTFQQSWGSRSYLTPIALSRLSRSQIESMAKRVAGGKGLPAEVVQQIVEKTDGVPLFVEEMTKAVLESGTLKEVNGQYELAGSLSSFSIPATLQDSLMARLDRLVTAKAVAQYASVIGRQFSYALLQAVSQLDEAMLQHELARLVASELLYQRGLPPQATYTFKHALIQDTAYQSLLKSTRQQYHQRIAQMLEAQFPETVETQPELLAQHFTEAGLDEQAIRYLQQAGKRAREQSAHLEAIAYFTAGLTMLRALPPTPTTARQELAIQIALGVVWMQHKGYGVNEVKQAYVRAQTLCEQLHLENSPEYFDVLHGLRRVYTHHGLLAEAQNTSERCLRIARKLQDTARLITSNYSLGYTLCQRGALQAGLSYLEQGVVDERLYFQTNVAHRRTPSCLVVSAWALWLCGFADQARQHSLEALAIVDAGEYRPFAKAWTLAMSATSAQFRWEIAVMYERADRALRIAAEHNFPQVLGWAMTFRGWAVAMQGQLEEGERLMHRGMDAFLALGLVANMSYFLALLAEVQWKMEKAGEALKTIGEALTLVADSGECHWEAEIHRLRGLVLLSGPPENHPEAETCFHQALAIARSQQAKSWELRAATSLARLWQSQGKGKAAYDLLQPVYDWFTEGFDTADLKEANALLQELEE